MDFNDDHLDSDTDITPVSDLGNTLLADYPIFGELNRVQTLVVIGSIVVYLIKNQVDIPSQVTRACAELSDEQLQIVLHRLTGRLESMPIPCDLCGAVPREPETGFCEECNTRLNGLAVLNIAGSR